MMTVTLRAHYDGVRIVLDEPSEQDREPTGGPGSARCLTRAYGDNQPEHTAAHLRP